MRRIRFQGGFTLVELMIVVALIGVLSAIAVPGFLSYQARSRRAESYSNLSALAVAQKGYQATGGTYHDSALPWPDSAAYGGLGTSKMEWDDASEGAYEELGWSPEGEVFYSYQSNTSTSCTCTLCFTATAYGDVDGNNKVSAVMYVEPQRNADSSVAGECRSGMGGALDFGAPTRPGSATGVYNEVAVQRITDEY